VQDKESVIQSHNKKAARARDPENRGQDARASLQYPTKPISVTAAINLPKPLSPIPINQHKKRPFRTAKNKHIPQAQIDRQS